MRGLITAIRTLTILPIPGKDAENMESALPWFPLVGFGLGSILYGIVYLMNHLQHNIWPEGTAVVLLMASVLLTRGIHLDGLCDWADGFWGASDKVRVLAIMKDSSIGTFGGAALFCILLAKWVCFTKLIENDAGLWIIPVYIISRTMQVAIAVAFDYAREEGTGKHFISKASFKHLILALLLGLFILFAVYPDVLTLVYGFVLAGLVATILGCHANRRIGGVTGDILGAGNEIIEISTLAFGAFFC